MAISQFKVHPVRFLSIAQNGKLCYGFNGELFTQIPGQEPVKVEVALNADQTENAIVH